MDFPPKCFIFYTVSASWNLEQCAFNLSYQIGGSAVLEFRVDSESVAPGHVEVLGEGDEGILPVVLGVSVVTRLSEA